MDLEAANELPQDDLIDLRIGPSNTTVRADNANRDGQEWGSNHNLIWPKLPNYSDTWNKWHCDNATANIIIDF